MFLQEPILTMTMVRYDPMLTGLSSCGDPSSWVADVWNNRCEHQHQHHISISSISASASASTTLFISRHLCPHYQRRERRRRNTTTTSSTLGILRLNMNHSHFLGAEMSLSLPWIESIIFIFLIFCF